MKKLLYGAVIALAAVLVVNHLDAKNLAPKKIKEIMSEGHKPPKKDELPLCGKASMGKASKDEVKKLLELYQDLPKNTPPKGDEADFKKKANALIAATKKLAEDPTDADAIAGYKKAVNCMACHSEHRPAK